MNLPNPRDIAAAIASAPPAPCDDCAMRKLCADEKLACESFLTYIDSQTDGTHWHAIEENRRSTGLPARAPNRSKYSVAFIQPLILERAESRKAMMQEVIRSGNLFTRHHLFGGHNG